MRALESGIFDAAIVDLHLENGRSGPRIARRLAERAIHTVILSGGELTVTIRGKGKGGASQRQKKNRRRMIGIGTPSSHNKIPRPILSSWR